MATTLSSTTPHRGRAMLFELANPELYQRNAFRILGLDVTANMRDIRRIGKRLKRRERLGREAGGNGDGYLPLEPAPDEDAVQSALQRLQEPIPRLLDEFFWFWPLQPGDEHDPILKELGEGRVQKVHKLWLEKEESDNHDHCATHNLAVLYHLWALDLERKAAKEQLNEKEQKTRLGCWRNAFERWDALLHAKPFWQRVITRIEQIDDPQLSKEVAREIHKAVGPFILLINARLAVKSAEAGNEGVAKRHVQIMRDSTFDAAVVGEALREALKSVRQRIKMACDPIIDNAVKEPKQAYNIGVTLLKETRPLLKMIDLMLTTDDPMWQGVHDEIANCGLQASINYGNKTDDWDPAVKLLDACLKIPPGTQSVIDRILHNLKIMRENLTFGRCYFCEQRQTTDASSHKVNFYSNVQKHFAGFNTYRVTWNTLELKIPRCPECMANHKRMDAYGGVGCTLMALLGIAGFYVNPWVGIGGMIGGAIGGLLLGNAIAKSNVEYEIKPSSDFKKFPRVVELVKEGWKFGEKPSDMEQQNAPMA